MSNFSQLQSAYIAAKKVLANARKALYLARQQSLLLEKRVGAFLAEQRLSELLAGHALAAERLALQKNLDDRRTVFTQAVATATTAREQFEASSDMKTAVSNLNGQIPVALFPLRLQTRFLTIKHIARNCPANLLVDINTLSAAARQSLGSFLPPSLPPKADPLAGISSQAYLLSNHPNSKAKNLIQTLNAVSTNTKRWQKVEDKYELWVRFFPDEILMQTHEAALTEIEMKAGIRFWEAMLLAQANGAAGGKEKQLEAWEQLQAAFSAPRAAWIARAMRPDNFPETILPAGQTLNFPNPEQKSEAWTLPPSTSLLPERICVRLYFPGGATREVTGLAIPESLQLGFDPDEPDETAFAAKETGLELPASIRWLTDFEEAEKIGMAVRITLTKAEMTGGISQMVALGVKTGADAAEGSKLLQELFENHRFKTNGMAFLPHGTPTNNLPGQPSGFSTAGLSAEESFTHEFQQPGAPDSQSDGRRLAAALGLPADALDGIYNHNGREATEALTMNRALWPATMGYFLDQLMRPAANDADIAFTKSFFQNFVTGRGLLPPFRVGKQPYGILPATVWSAWKPDASASAEEKRLVSFLKRMNAEWGKLTQQVKTVKKVFEQYAAPGNEESLKREFREILSLQASSTRYFRRLVAGEYLLWNLRVNVDPSGEKTGTRTTPPSYLNMLQGADGWGQALAAKPRMLGKFLENDRYQLTDFQQDTLAGSNNVNASGENYLCLLLDATADQLRDGAFGDDYASFVRQKSSVLMFQLARFSLLQGWIAAATALVRKEKTNVSPFARLDFEFEYLNDDKQPSFEHNSLLAGFASANYETRKNKWAFLEEKLTNGQAVKDFITNQLQTVLANTEPARALQESLEAFDVLKTIPDERLERLMTEHLDLCSFRLDAWLQGLALARLSAQRNATPPQQGVFVGAYGYLENLKPDAVGWVKIVEIAAPAIVLARTAPVETLVVPVYNFAPYSEKQLEKVRYHQFVYLGSDAQTSIIQHPALPILAQSGTTTNTSEEGFLLTPSIEHATTAAILRAGYQHHARAQGPESKTLSVDLDPGRTGRALDMLKAVQAGHSLNEQLGYFIERKMYETPALASLVPVLRSKFPLRVENQGWDDASQTAPSNNLSLVLDGLELLQERRNAGNSTAATFKWNQAIPAGSRPGVGAIVDQAERLFDAVSDLTLAESVFQTVKGNPERAAAALRTTSEGAVHHLPEIAQIPGETRTLNYRMGFALHPQPSDPKAWPLAVGQTPSIAAQLSPELNRWLAGQLPAPDRIFATTTTVDGSQKKVSLAEIGLQPIDFYTFIQKSGGNPANSLLAFLVAEKSGTTLPAVGFQRDGTFTEQEYAVEELLPVLACLKKLLDNSRPMRPEDWTSDPAKPDQAAAPIDNSSLLQASTRVSDAGPNGIISIFLQKLEQAAGNLRDNPPVGIDTATAEAAFDLLYQLLPQAWRLGFWDALPACPPVCDAENTQLLLEKADQIGKALQMRRTRAIELLGTAQTAPLSGDTAKQFDQLVQVARLFAGDDFRLLPRFQLTNPGEIQSTFNDAGLLENAGEFGVEEWLQGWSVLRDGPRQYQMLCNLREAIPAPASEQHLKIMQTPFLSGQKNAWIGARFPKNYTPPAGVVSLAIECPPGFTPQGQIAGIVLDDWREKLPLPESTAGISINYDQPNNEAPQTLLLAVTPERQDKWQWEQLVSTILETVDLARKRLVDTEMVQSTWLNQFLPALVAPVDPKKNTATLNFGVAGPPILDFSPGGIGGIGGLGTVILHP